ncbi:hypothetical protein EG329_003309 [Mollisiaceae sp. DMI_Dod_QoI]|nr:hypothetical protein EG329_003309 [Helotiales sp. DMI_Dod_QoI]
MAESKSRRSTGNYPPSLLWRLKGKRPSAAMDPTSTSHCSPQPPEMKEKYVYQPLDTKVDATRLVTIKPAANDSDPIVCSVARVTFSQRPNFEALSYRWGTEDADMTISINGRTFFVRRNLHDALLFLRRFSRSLPVWIDAICINQEDIAERNWQVRIMPHIYSRATTVLVWLGAKYSKYHALKDQGVAQSSRRRYPTELQDPFEHHEWDTNREINQRKMWDDMLGELYSDGYWRRVWIVHEIGKAQQIEVCYGFVAERWGNFIQHFAGERHRNRFPTTVGPLKLEHGQRGKYKGAHTFWALLKTHHDAEALDLEIRSMALLDWRQTRMNFL